MIGQLKHALRRALESRGYFIRPASQFGFSLGEDLRRLLAGPAPAHIFDVGANAGQWLESIKRTFPEAHLHCYEPDARPFTRLEERARQVARVECLPCALGRAPGTLPFFRNADSVTSSLLKTVAPAEPLPYAEKLVALDAVEVEVRTVTSELQRLGLDRLDLLKTDCQGFDLQVLQGAAPAIEAGQIELITTEALFHREYDGQAWFHEILAWLSERDFALVGLYDILHDAQGRALFGDALFVSRRRSSGFA